MARLDSASHFQHRLLVHKTLRRQGFPVLYIQTDEGGELGRSTDFLKCLTSHECIFLGTGRAGSSLNGKVERPNRTIANSVRAKLLNSGLPDEFWCYAAEDANYKLRRMLHSAIHTTPYEAWTKRKPSYSDMKIWGCHVYIVDTDVSRTKLSNRTFVGLFMKFASTTKIIVYYNPITRKFGRTSHAYFDELNIVLGTTHTTTQSTIPYNPGKYLISKYPTIPPDMKLSPIKSNLSTLPILIHPAVTFKVVLPPKDEICPITFHNDDIYGLPYVKHIPAHTPIGRQLPSPVLQQQWILGIGTEEPIHATSALEEFNRLRSSHANDTISLTMAPRVTENHNKYESERSKFDQMRPILASVSDKSSLSPSNPQDTIMKPLENNATHVLPSDSSSIHHSDLIDIAGITVPTISILVHSSIRPTITTNVQDCFHTTNPLQPFWIQTAYKQYDKNASYRVFAKPIPRSNLPSNTLILKSVLAPNVKHTTIDNL